MAKKVAAKPKRRHNTRKTPLDLNTTKAKRVRGMANVASLPDPVAKGKKAAPKKSAAAKAAVKKLAAKKASAKRSGAAAKNKSAVGRGKVVRAKAASQSPAVAAPEAATAQVEPAKLAKAFGRRKSPSRIGTFTPGGMVGRISD